MTGSDTLRAAGHDNHLRAPLGEAVDAFLAASEPAAGYFHAEVGGYRALCTPGAQPSGAPGAAGRLEPVLLVAGDGAVYLPEGERGPAEQILRQRRFRPTGSTLALRLPAAMGGGARTFALWAS